MNWLEKFKLLLWLEYIPRNIDINEELTRYVFYKRHINNGVKWAAFKPARDGDTSVYRIKKLTEDLIWFISYWYVEKKRRDNRKCCGRADIPINKLAEPLTINSTFFPNPRHCNISNWPDPDKEESKLLLVKTELAQAARATLKPESN